MPNVLSTYGLAMQGADQGRAVQQNYDMNQQRSQLVGQDIDTGAMNLDEMRRQRAEQAAMRGAGAASVAAGKTLSGSLLDMSDAAAKLGDIQTATQYRVAYKQLEDNGVKDVVHTALTDPRPGDRPDLVQVLNQYDRSKGVTAATLDNAGNLVVTRGGQAQPPIQVGKLAELMGMVKPPELKTIPAGGKGVVLGPGRNPTDPANQIDTQKTFAEHPKEGYVTKTSKDADGNEVQHIIDVRPGSPTYGQEVAPDTVGAGGTAGGPNVRKDLPVMKEITDGVAGLGGEYGQTDMSNPLNPKITLTPKGQQVALVAEQIRQANQGLAPRTIIDMAVKGRPMWKTENGQRTGVVIYNGQEFPMLTPKAGARAAPAAAAPRAAPQPAAGPPAGAATVSAPAVQPAPAPGAAPIESQPAAAPAAVAQPAPTGATHGPSDRRYEPQLEARDPQLKQLGNMLRLGMKNPNLDYQTWARYVVRARQLGSTLYAQTHAKGGKVSRKQHHGLR